MNTAQSQVLQVPAQLQLRAVCKAYRRGLAFGRDRLSCLAGIGKNG